MRPYVHLFQTPEYNYLYDVNKNNYIQISSKLYSHLHNTLSIESNNEEYPEELKSEVDQLMEEGYLSTNRINYVKHPKTDDLDDYMTRKLHLLTIQLTHNCNLRCSYCPYTSNDGSHRLHDAKTINYETIEKALLFLRDNSIDSDEVTVGFYGGEPLLEFELLKDTVTISQKIFEGKPINYTITTNGTLLTEQVLEFLQSYEFQVILSLDGPKEVNDSNRKFAYESRSVYDTVVERINHIHKHYPELKEKIGLNMVMDPRKTFDEYARIFNEIPILKDMLVSATVLDDDYKLEEYGYSEDFRNQSNYAHFLTYLNAFNELEINEYPFYNIVFNETVQETMGDFSTQISLGDYFCPSGPCIPGENRLMVDVNGIFYPCERINEKIDFNAIGDINKGFNFNKASSILNVASTNEIQCKDCFAFRHCTLCVKGYESLLLGDSKLGQKCESVRNNFNHELVAKAIIKEIKNA